MQLVECTQPAQVPSCLRQRHRLLIITRQLIGSDADVHRCHQFAPRFVDVRVRFPGVRVVGKIVEDCMSIADGEASDRGFGEQLDDSVRNRKANVKHGAYYGTRGPFGYGNRTLGR